MNYKTIRISLFILFILCVVGLISYANILYPTSRCTLSFLPYVAISFAILFVATALFSLKKDPLKIERFYAVYTIQVIFLFIFFGTSAISFTIFLDRYILEYSQAGVFICGSAKIDDFGNLPVYFCGSVIPFSIGMIIWWLFNKRLD